MTTHRHLLHALALAAGLALLAPSAHAQAFDAVRLYGAAPGTNGGTLGAAVVAGHEYLGSDRRLTLVAPVLDYQWANGWFAGSSNGIGYNFSTTAPWQYGVRLTLDPGRKQSRSADLKGMGTVDPAVEGGVFLNFAMPQGPFVSSSVRYGAGNDHRGLVVDLGAGYLTALAPRWHLAADVAVTLANARYLQSSFGVTGKQSAASGYVPYQAGSGARDVRANLALTWSIDPLNSITTALSATRLLGDSKDSPLTRQRSAGTAIVAIAHAY